MPNSAPAATAMPLLLSGPTSNNCLYSSASRKYTILYMLIHGLHPTDINNAEIATNALGCALCAVYADKRQCSNTFFNLQLQCESKKIPPCVFQTIFFPNGWEFLTNFSHTYYGLPSALDYKFLFNYLQL